MVLLVGDCEQQKQDREIYFHIVLIREAFQTKKRGNLGNGAKRGGRKKIKKVQVSVGNSSKLGGGLRKSKKSQVPEGTKN